MFDKNKFIKIVKNFLNEKNITQENFANMIEVELSSVSRWLSQSEKATSIPRKKHIKKICEKIGINEKELFSGETVNLYENYGVLDLELEKFSRGKALEYMNLFNHRFPAEEPVIEADFDFEPEGKTEVELVKEFIKLNDAILFVSAKNNSFSDYYIKKDEVKYYDLPDDTSLFDNDWYTEIRDNTIAKLTFISEINEIFTNLEDKGLYIFAGTSFATDYYLMDISLADHNGEENIKKYIEGTMPLPYVSFIEFEDRNLIVQPSKYNKLNNVISKKKSDRIVWSIPTIKFYAETKFTEHEEDTDSYLERFEKFYWSERSNGNDLISNNKLTIEKLKEVNM